jgi:hypothetical protein
MTTGGEFRIDSGSTGNAPLGRLLGGLDAAQHVVQEPGGPRCAWFAVHGANSQTQGGSRWSARSPSANQRKARRPSL